MANLVPLHVDKDSGKIVARGGGIGGRATARGFLYEQIVAASVWNIPHNKENDRVIVQIYDEVGEFTIPDKIDIIDINNIQITYGAPMAGTAHILFFSST